MSARYRLQEYRDKAASSRWSNDWRSFRHAVRHYPLRWSDDRKLIYADDLDQFGTVEGRACDIARTEVIGYYCDPIHEFDAIQPHVVRLRTARGTMYIPAANFDDADGAVFWPDSAEIVPRGSCEGAHDDAKRDAAREADRLCRRYAEDEKEARVPEAAANDAEELRDQAKASRAEARAMLAELRQVRAAMPPEAAPKLCAALRADIRRLLLKAREDYATARRYMADPNDWYSDMMGRYY